MPDNVFVDNDRTRAVALVDALTGKPYGATGGAAGIPVQDAQLLGKGDATYSLSTAVTLATAAAALGGIPTGSTQVVIQPIGGPIYFTRDSQTPTASLGVQIADGQPVQITATAAGLAAIKLFAASSTPVRLQFKG